MIKKDPTKAKVPTRHFYHDGTRYILTGNFKQALSHFHEINNYRNGLKRTNVNNLPIISGQKIFTDGTEASVTLIHGIETINIFSPIPIPPVPAGKTEWQLVPCMVITGDERYSPEIKGYIACLSGSFQGPYQFFDIMDEDDPAVLEGFYHEGFEDYDEDLAFNHLRLLSPAIDKNLFYFKPSGLAPDDDRATQGPEFGHWAQTKTCSTTYCFERVLSEQSMEAQTFFDVAIGTSGGQYGWYLQFDGQDICLEYTELPTFGGSYLVAWDFGVLVTDANEPPDMESVQADIDAYTEAHTGLSAPVPCGYTFETTKSFDYYSTNKNDYGSFLDDYPNNTVRVNAEGLAHSAYLLEISHRDAWGSSWNHRDWFSPYYSSYPCDGCTESSSTWRNELKIVVDRGEPQSLTDHFGWAYDYKYQSMYGLGLVYHHFNDSGGSIALATAIAGPDDGNYSDMAFAYSGPSAEGLNGSVSFPVLSDSLDRYVIVPDVIEMPEDADFEGKVRGHVFLGLIQRTITKD